MLGTAKDGRGLNHWLRGECGFTHRGEASGESPSRGSGPQTVAMALAAVRPPQDGTVWVLGLLLGVQRGMTSL